MHSELFSRSMQIYLHFLETEITQVVQIHPVGFRCIYVDHTISSFKQEALRERRPPPRLVWGVWNSLFMHKQSSQLSPVNNWYLWWVFGCAKHLNYLILNVQYMSGILQIYQESRSNIFTAPLSQIQSSHKTDFAWWRHQMETFSA